MTKFSSDEKVQAVMRYEKGSESLKSIAKSIGISPLCLFKLD